MADFVFVAIVLGFFGLCALYIRGCDRLLRGSQEAADPTDGVTR